MGGIASKPSENWTALTLSLSPRRGNLPCPRREELPNTALILSSRQLRARAEREGRHEGELRSVLNCFGCGNARLNARAAISAQPSPRHTSG